MKRMLFLLLSCLFATILLAQGRGKPQVEVLYFHGKQRCVSCRAMEKYAREVVEQNFAREYRQGKVVFRVVDITTKAGAQLAKSYRVTWSSLYVTGWKHGKATRCNLTQFGFRYARKDSNAFKQGLVNKIKEQLK